MRWLASVLYGWLASSGADTASPKPDDAGYQWALEHSGALAGHPYRDGWTSDVGSVVGDAGHVDLPEWANACANWDGGNVHRCRVCSLDRKSVV